MLRLKQAFDIMRKSDPKGENTPFSVSFFTYDKKTRLGGKRIDLQNCRIIPTSHDMREHDTIGIRTENTAHDYTVHVRLITHVNNIRVTW
jgi:hypothetical protein